MKFIYKNLSLIVLFILSLIIGGLVSLAVSPLNLNNLIFLLIQVIIGFIIGFIFRGSYMDKVIEKFAKEQLKIIEIAEQSEKEYEVLHNKNIDLSKLIKSLDNKKSKN